MINTTNRVPREVTKPNKSCCTKVLPILGVIIIGIIAYVVMDNSKPAQDNSGSDQPAKSSGNTEPHQKADFEGVMNIVKGVEKELKDMENVYKLEDKDIEAYLKEYDQSPSTQAAENLFKLSHSLAELKRYNEACAILNKLEAGDKNIPDSLRAEVRAAKLQYCK